MLKGRIFSPPGMMIIFICISLPACTSSNTGTGAALGYATDEIVAGAQDGDLRVVAELPPPPSTSGVEQAIAPSDILDITVFQVPSLSGQVQVDEAGSINLPLIGVRQAADKSVRVLEQEITAAYAANYLQSPQIVVQISESASRRVTVDGEVNRAGVYPLPPSSSLLDAIALAGSLSDIADPDKVFIFRQIGESTLVANYSLAEIRQGRRASPRIYGGDRVIVFASQHRVAMRNLREVLGIASSASRIAVIP